jgi:Immunity protein 26
MAKRVRYQEGDVFAVPLRDGGYGVGVVARASSKGPVLGYFLGPRRDDVPELSEVEDLEAVDNVLVQKFGDLGLIRGKWPLIGHLPGWRREQWPMPAFGRHEELTGRYLRVEYADDDPNSRPREVEISRDEFEHLPEDGLAGFGFTEARLTRLLATSPPREADE